MANKWVYMFSEGNMTMRNLLGGKGANLAEMTTIGLPVPQGFTITTEACTQYYEDGRKINDEIMTQVMDGVKKMEEINGKKFGDKKNPLLVSVRSGARASMPGMMDTILNLGLNDDVVAAMIEGNPDPAFERFVYDSYRRFIQMFSDVVMEVGKKYFEQLIDKMKEEKGVKFDVELTAADLKTLAEQFKAEYKKQLGSDFPSDPVEQLKLAIEAVFRSWDNPRANVYRRDNDIPYSWGTAVNVMPMVFGNLNNESGTGVAFTRDPATGEKKLMGEFLINAQGEDVVAGVRTPMPIAQMEQEFPEAYAEFIQVCKTLEDHYHDMQDMEFTVENKKLYMLQCRNGKRTAQAALQIACDLVDEGHKTEEEAVLMIDPRNLDTLLHPQFDAKALKAATPIGKGLGASPGAACGKVVFTADDAEAWNAKGEKVVLVRLETSPEDITGMKASQGILTVRGGMTSHAAVVARGMGTPCVSGSTDITIDYAKKTMATKSGVVVKEGDWVSLDGAKGQIIEGKIPTVKADTNSGNFGKLMSWVDEIRTMSVRANAETPKDAQTARDFGAEGIGLARTEHMFFDADRIPDMRAMILSENEEGRRAALAKLLPYQKQDFKDLFKIMDGLPVTVRLLDPPLHEFLPHTDAEMKELADKMGMTLEQVKNRANALHEANPMLGHRGCRLAVTYPEIAEMQTRAILEAALECQDAGIKVTPEIEVPLIGSKKELDIVKAVIDATAEKVFAEKGKKIDYLVGTMIELPRAALMAEEIAQSAAFFGFGTNDLTQTTLGMSRDDTGAILDEYRAKGVYVADPFASIDVDGVGKLVRRAAVEGRATNPDLHLGVCGEHGGDPKSIEFFNAVGLDYVSCSPYRVPVARLAAAQAAVKQKGQKKAVENASHNSACCCKAC